MTVFLKGWIFMKKLFALLLILLLIPCAFAESIDLSGLSFEELAALRDRCQSEMMTRNEWQQVTVPQGLWQVGAQIPAGTWTVRCADRGRTSYLMKECHVDWGIGQPNDKGQWDYKLKKGGVIIYNPYNDEYKDQVTEVTITLEEGDFVYINPQYNAAVFMPYTGAPDLGFK